ncbi:hypothetical protein ACFLV3_01565 [Chloroflexota bacterium]
MFILSGFEWAIAGINPLHSIRSERNVNRQTTDEVIPRLSTLHRFPYFIYNASSPIMDNDRDIFGNTMGNSATNNLKAFND